MPKLLNVRTLGLGAATAGLVLMTAGPASAHVTVTPSTTAAGAYTVLSFAAGHGCGTSSTTKIAIKMPEPVLSVSPTINPGWDVEKVMQTLDTPADDGHGGQYTERVDQVVYTAKTPLKDGFRETWDLSLKLPETAGETLAFPVIQTCEKGETAWIETTVEGEDEPESPAPFITLTDAEGDGHGADATAEETEATEEAAAETTADTEPVSATTEAADSDEAGSSTVGWIGAVLGALGLLLGGLALSRTRKTS